LLAIVFWRFRQKPARRDRFKEEIINNGVFLAKWMLFAFFFRLILKPRPVLSLPIAATAE
jgi:hypothetical protein